MSMTLASLTTSFCSITVEGEAGPFTCALSIQAFDEDVDLVRLTLSAPTPCRPPKMALRWRLPMVRAHQVWHPSCHTNRSIPMSWQSSTVASRGTTNAPVAAIFDLDGRNTLTFAFSDCLNAVDCAVGVEDHGADAGCVLRLFQEPHPLVVSYEAVLRLDRRRIPLWQALREVAAWWETLPGMTPAVSPDCARLPTYCTWYSMHQKLRPADIERQCQLAKGLGMDAIIIDDGWQTEDTGGGYSYCGDWEVALSKFPDLRAHVDRVHALGMKVILWFSVPFVGANSQLFVRFRDKLLNAATAKPVYVLDPRFPEVREFLIAKYERALREWGVDGLKLDFVDEFKAYAETQDLFGEGRDFDSVPAAAQHLLLEVMTRLRAIRPDLMIEFRQAYTGPHMRACGNMFRSVDVPNDIAGNRIRTVDLRLLSRATAVHADPFMWNLRDPVESAALFFAHTFFAVPQISMLLDQLPADHLAMMGHYLRTWRAYRDVLLDGEFMPQAPELLYPVVIARSSAKLAAAVYGRAACISIAQALPADALIINGTLQRGVVVQLSEDAGVREVTVSDCTGAQVSRQRLAMPAGVLHLDIPPAGLATLRA